MKRSQLVLLALVLGLGSFYAWAKLDKVRTEDAKYQEARYFPKLEAEDVQHIKVVSREPQFAYDLYRKGDRWFIDSHLLNIEKSYQLVSSYLELSREREMDPAPDQTREAEFHLDQPNYSITVWDNSGKDLGTVKLGSRAPDSNHYYGQWQAGGAISTVPAYTLSTMEEKPDALRELSLFPVEATAVDKLTVEKEGKVVVVLELEKEKFRFVEPKLGMADESKVKDFLLTLKDLKVGRFLAKEEKTSPGPTSVSYRADLSYSEFDQVTEIQGPVAVQPKFRYGRRFLAQPGSDQPVEGTEERFVVELAKGSNPVEPSATLFEDRRVAVFDLDKVKSITLETAQEKRGFRKGVSGQWELEDKSKVNQEAVNGLLWTLKDLRFEALDQSLVEPSSFSVTVRLGLEDKSDLVVRFSLPESGKPYLWREAQGYALSASSKDALVESVEKAVKASKESK